MRAVIIANGKISDFEKIKKYIKKGDYIICADGGYNYSEQLGVEPDIIIGDMDSVKKKTLHNKTIVYPTKKDLTDSEIVLDYAVKNGFDELLLLGFTGGRADHMLTNIMLLFKYSDTDIKIIDEYSEIYLAKKTNVINSEKGTTISIIPMCGNLEGVTTKGLEYPLSGENLYFGEGRGVSNVMLSDKCEISIESGKGLIIKSTD